MHVTLHVQYKFLQVTKIWYRDTMENPKTSDFLSDCLRHPPFLFTLFYVYIFVRCVRGGWKGTPPPEEWRQENKIYSHVRSAAQVTSLSLHKTRYKHERHHRFAIALQIFGAWWGHGFARSKTIEILIKLPHRNSFVIEKRCCCYVNTCSERSDFPVKSGTRQIRFNMNPTQYNRMSIWLEIWN